MRSSTIETGGFSFTHNLGEDDDNDDSGGDVSEHDDEEDNDVHSNDEGERWPWK